MANERMWREVADRQDRKLITALWAERDQLKARCEELAQLLVDAEALRLADESDVHQLRALLQQIDAKYRAAVGLCPICNQGRTVGAGAGHRADCKLAAALEVK